ncbi:hypothetical protein J5X84_02690 [Streptosporangiaceae bacterium NEAU-GS5]|nr:hypothetical protein [Streptosporangiaceae bacterium NEAU-GS5]
MAVRRFRLSALLISGVTSVGVLVSGVGVPDGLVSQAVAAAPQAGAPEPSVSGRPVPHPILSKGAEDTIKAPSWVKPVWPKAGAAVVTLPTSSTTPVAAGALPVQVGRSGTATPGSLRVDTFDDATARRLGGVGLAVRLTRADGLPGTGRAKVTVNYASFRDAYPANFASRLRLVSLPACVLDAALTAACKQQVSSQARQVPVRNDVPSGTLTADADAGPTSAASVLVVTSSALASDPGTGTSNFAATDLKPSGTWQAGQSGGEFSYSYPLTMPPSVGGQPPSLALSYSSSSVDGLSQYTNNQASWTGMGWDIGTGFIERRYRACSNDLESPFTDNQNQPEWRHLCWESPDENDSESATTDKTHSQLVLSVAGKSSPIVWDTTNSKWKTVEDFGWKIEYLTPTSPAAPSGQPYWQITTQDGTVYRFGYNRDSSLQVPYLGDDTGEPCHSSFPADEPVASSFCVAPYRWNLDQEIDPRHNVTSYSYLRETNRYCSDPDFGCFFSGAFWLNYDRAATLAQITYGSNTAVAGSAPTGRVTFATVDRGQAPQVGLPWDDDTPDDLIDGDDPAFFTSKRLNSVTTATANGTGGWDDVTRWELGYRWVIPPSGGGFYTQSAVLWLDSIRQVGLAGNGADIALPKVGFDSVVLDNRADYDDNDQARLALPRISAIANGLGGRIEVTYGQTNPCAVTGDNPYQTINGATNAKDCFQILIGGLGSGVTGTYEKYQVTRVVEKDLVAGSPDMTTRYQYLGTPAWAKGFDYNKVGGICAAPSCVGGINEAWDQWRGYQSVRTLKGIGTDPAAYSVTSSSFFRGMWDDPNGSGTAKHIQVTDFDGTNVNDLRILAGRTLQEQTWTATAMATPVNLCAYPAWVATTLYAAGDRVTRNNHHWRATTSTRGHTPGTDSDWADLGACPTSEPIPGTFAEQSSTRYEYGSVATGNGPGIYDPAQINQTRVVSRAKVSSGWRYTDSATTYNSDGLPWKVNDYGDTSTSVDNTCTTNTYAKNISTPAWMIAYPARVERRTGDDCNAGTFLGRTLTLYDGATTEGANAPTIGNATEIRTYTSDTDFTAVKAAYDGYGRTISTTNPLNKTTTTTYSPAVGWPAGGMAVSNPLSQTTTTWLSAFHGQVIGIRDPNAHDVNIDYDSLGRTITLWTPGQPKSAGVNAASVTYTIPVDANGAVNAPAMTATSRLLSTSGANPMYSTTYSYDDGLGRTREAQVTSPAGGRVVTAITYNNRGLSAAAGDPFYNANAAGSGLVNAAMTSLSQWSSMIYDGLERMTADIDMSGVGELRRTTTAYFGDRTETTPPVGGKRVAYTDSDDQVTKVEEWVNATTHYDTVYAYTISGQLAASTDANGNVRTFTYDLLGHQIAGHDPDAGDSAQSYDANGQLLWSTDGMGVRTSFTYDDLGRRTGMWSGEVGTGTKQAEWIYDTVQAGKQTSAIRYVNGQPYTDTVTGYDVMGRPTGYTLSIPSTEGLLAGSYSFSTSYAASGEVEHYTTPAAGGLPAETVTSTYTDLGLPAGMTSDYGGGFTYVASTGYSETARVVQRAYGPNSQVKRVLDWDPATGWLSRITTSKAADTVSPQMIQDDRFTYDPSGQVTRILDAASAVGGSPGQSECFNYDGVNRLTAAWTTTASACGSSAASSDGLGIDPYAQTFAFDGVGNLTTVVDGAQTATYGYPAAGASSVRPNAVTSVNRVGGAGAGADAYSYDAAGQLTGRTVDGKSSTFVWDELGQLVRATVDGQDTTMVYGADGNRLIRRDPDGSATLYLEDMEVRASGPQLTATRYYTAPDEATVALRTTQGATGLKWLTAGLHDSMQLAIDDASGNVSRERYLPFGARRGSDDLPFTDRGFLGKIEDASTGLDYLSARYYDPTIAKFVSTDPLLDVRRPQWANAYAYAGNNPIGLSDPEGLSVPVNPSGDGPACNTTAAECAAQAWNECMQRLHSSVKCQQEAVHNAEELAGKAWDALIKIVKELGKVVLDELGITAGLDCVLKGDMAACGETAINIFASFIGGAIGKLAVKYGLPWKWAKAAELANKLWKLGGRAIDAVKDWLKAKGFVKKTEEALKEACKVSSFLPGTRVLMADGTYSAIEDVEVGDLVMAGDPITGRSRPEPVLALVQSGGDKTLITITIAYPGVGLRTDTVTATDHHPFWSADEQHWFNADQLRPGMWLRTAAGTYVQITAVAKSHVADQTVRNLVVAELGTYYVAVGAADVLVHNGNDGPSGILFRSGKYVFQIYANDHGPAHGHLKGKGFDIQIGQNGKPLDKDVVLNAEQKRILDQYRSLIRSTLKKKMAEYRKNRAGC